MGDRKKEAVLVYTAAVSDTEITGMCIVNDTCLAVCKDKSVKRIDKRGQVLSGIEGHRKGIWTVSTKDDIVATGSSDKTVRVWKEGTTQHILQHKMSVIKSTVVDKETVLTATSEGTLHIWNMQKEKELATKKLAETKEEKIWAIREIAPCMYAVSAGGTLYSVRDNTKEIEKQREETRRTHYIVKQKADAHMRKKEYAEAAVEYFRVNMQRETKEAVRRISTDMPVAHLVQQIGTEQEKALHYVSRWCRAPQLAHVSTRIVAEIAARKWRIPETRTKELAAILQRTSEMMDEAY